MAHTAAHTTAHTTTKTEIPWLNHCWLVVERLRARGEHRCADAIAAALRRYEQRWGVGQR